MTLSSSALSRLPVGAILRVTEQPTPAGLAEGDVLIKAERPNPSGHWLYACNARTGVYLDLWAYSACAYLELVD